MRPTSVAAAALLWCLAPPPPAAPAQEPGAVRGDRVAGDRLVGGCRELLPPGYAACRPETSLRHPAPECAGTECGHFLDIAIARHAIAVRARLIDPLPDDVTLDTITWKRLR